jgi:polyhydroxybutyrate depolymerase
MRAFVLLGLVCACSTTASTASSDAGSPVRGGNDPLPFGGARPVSLYVPSGYETSVPAPLLIMLHGYGASGTLEEIYLDLQPTAEARTVLYAHPNGTTDTSGMEFWNATDGCCNFFGSTIDDSGYLAGLVAEIGTRYTVDPKRVYFVGHDNGGFMTYRMACDHADLVAGIASLEGAMWENTARCTPGAAVTIVEIHGTADQQVLYTGSSASPAYPGAPVSVSDWATFDGCLASADAGTSLQLEAGDGGPDTSVARFVNGCHGGTEADLWSIDGGTHIPALGPQFAPAVFSYLLAHPKP